MEFTHDPPHQGSTSRGSNGCWTCRLRRKKCNGLHPICGTCATLNITCHYDQHRPDWLDGGVRQQEMAGRFKQEVKRNAQRRGRDELGVMPQESPRDLTEPSFVHFGANPDMHNTGTKPCPPAATPSVHRGADCTLTNKDTRDRIAFGRSETILLMFYLENLLPFLFPFYRPSIVQGGKAWMLEMMISSPVIRQATLCQSSYFLSLSGGTDSHDVAWETVLVQTKDAFEILGQALQVIDGAGIVEHLHGAVRIMASIIQVQRFEIAVSSFDNCQAHLNAAVAIFEQLINSTYADDSAATSFSHFNAFMSRLGPSPVNLPAQSVQLPSAEQAAFLFSSGLLIFDDIIASTVLKKRPALYNYHYALLEPDDGTGPPLNLEAVVGCQNCTLLQIGQISNLDAWKQQRQMNGDLDVMELVHMATDIRNSLDFHLKRLEEDLSPLGKENNSLLDVFTANCCQQAPTSASQSSLATRVWTHAASIYLFVVVSGWQPANPNVRDHVDQIIKLLRSQISPPALLRAMVWPFCVAGCVAEREQEHHFREMVRALQPQSVFGTVRKALEIMENVWRDRDNRDAGNRDLATCFNGVGDLVLLV